MIKSLSKVTLILAAALLGCNSAADERAMTQDAPGSATGDPGVVHHPEPPARPGEKIDSIQVEGTYERFTAKLVESSVPPRFSTYLPADMVFEPVSSGEGDGYYFHTNFGGARNENAFLLVFVFPERTSQANAQQMLQAFKASRNATSTEGDRFTFQRNGTRLHGGISLHDENGRYYYVAEQYPAEYGDGFGPRAEFIKKQWVWLDTGSSL